MDHWGLMVGEKKEAAHIQDEGVAVSVTRWEGNQVKPFFPVFAAPRFSP